MKRTVGDGVEIALAVWEGKETDGGVRSCIIAKNNVIFPVFNPACGEKIGDVPSTLNHASF